MRAKTAFLAALTSLIAAQHLRSEPSRDPFSFLKPAIQFSDEDLHHLDARKVLLRILPGEGQELATLAAGSLDVDSDAFVSSVRDMPDLKKGPLVPEIERFSTPPQPGDVQPLTLERVDLDEIKGCRPERPEHCGLTLEPEEIAALQKAISTAHGDPNGAIDREFRQIVLERATRYLTRGDQATNRQFSVLLQHSPYVQSRLPQLVAYLESYPGIPLPGAESFLYWSKEMYAWKPMITVTHVTILRSSGENGAPEVLVASRDIFSTRYTSGSLVLAMLFRDPGEPSRHYLVYINRTLVDGMRALWRPFVELRIKGQARKVFAAARDRIEEHALASASSR